MKKPVKKIWLFVCVAIGLLLFSVGAAIVKVHIETRNMSSLETQEVIEAVYAVKDSYVNLFLIRSRTRYIAVDAGNNAGHIRQELNKLKIDPQKVAAVFLTHSDADHIAGLSLFKNADIYLPSAEEQMINGQTSRFLFFKNKPAYPYKLLEENQVLNIDGITVKGISTPGHTPGSMCYLINDAYLFTGDSMRLKNGKVSGFNDFFNMDSKIQQRSLGKLADLPDVKAVFTAHYGFTDNYQVAFGQWKDH